MTKSNQQVATVLLMSVLLAGCATAPSGTDQAAPTQATQATQAQTRPDMTVNGKAMVGASFGKGAYEMGDGSKVMFIFDSSLFDDKSSDGFIQLRGNLPGGPIDIEGKVTCLAMDRARNLAWIGGTITKNESLNPGFLKAGNLAGSDIWFRVLGADTRGTPTRFSAPGFKGDDGIRSAAQFCKKTPWPADNADTYVVVNGTLGVFP